MHYFPLFADLADKHCLVVGGGIVASRRVKLMLRSGARLTIRAPEICANLRKLAAAGSIEIEQAPYEDMALDKYWLVVAATNNPEVNAAVAEAAHRAKRFCNVVDDPDQCSFIMAAIIDRAPVSIAISTAGYSPVLARWLKGVIERVVPTRVGNFAKFLKSQRASVLEAIPDNDSRRHFWSAAVNGKPAENAYAGKVHETAESFAGLLEEWQSSAAEGHGEAYIVGAGPGDPDLITVRGRQLLANADVVLYDRLVNLEILEFARRDAMHICVGKQAGQPSMPQEDINNLLVRLVREGKRVCRLKGGDPMVFGRIAEELAALTAAGLRFQIVPGITAVGGCSAYSGIPLTWRGLSQSVLITTGHTATGDTATPSLAGHRDHTIAVYMAAARHREVAQGFLSQGMDHSTPVAIIENGTRPNQVTRRMSLGALADPAEELVVATPALLIIGHVVDAASEFAWFEKAVTVRVDANGQ